MSGWVNLGGFVTYVAIVLLGIRDYVQERSG